MPVRLMDLLDEADIERGILCVLPHVYTPLAVAYGAEAASRPAGSGAASSRSALLVPPAPPELARAQSSRAVGATEACPGSDGSSSASCRDSSSDSDGDAGEGSMAGEVSEEEADGTT